MKNHAINATKFQVVINYGVVGIDCIMDLPRLTFQKMPTSGSLCHEDTGKLHDFGTKRSSGPVLHGCINIYVSPEGEDIENSFLCRSWKS